MTTSDEGDALFAKAERAFARTRYTKAAGLWLRVGENPDAVFNAGNAYAAAGELGRAKEAYRSAILAGVADAYLNLAYLLEDEGDQSSADELIEHGARMGDPGASVELARRIEQNDPVRARSLAEPFRRHEYVGKYACTILARLDRLDSGDDASDSSR